MSDRKGVITKLTLSNIGCFGDSPRDISTELNFERPIVILRGANASGKSTVAYTMQGLASDDPDPRDLGARRKGDYKGADEEKSPRAVLLYRNGDGATWDIGTGMSRTAAVTPRLISGISDPVMLKGIEARRFWDDTFRVSINLQEISAEVNRRFDEVPKSLWDDYINALNEILDELIDEDKDDSDVDEMAKMADSFIAKYRSEVQAVTGTRTRTAKKLMAELEKGPKVATSAADGMECPKCGTLLWVNKEGKLQDTPPEVKVQVDDADVAHAKVTAKKLFVYETLADVISPDGIKKEKRKGIIKDFQKRLDALHKRADTPLPKVLLDPDSLEVELHGRAIGLASTGERWFASALVRLAALSMRTGESMVCVIDGADVLGASKGIANGFWKACARMAEIHGDCTIVVCATDFDGDYMKQCLKDVNQDLIQVIDI